MERAGEEPGREERQPRSFLLQVDRHGKVEAARGPGLPALLESPELARSLEELAHQGQPRRRWLQSGERVFEVLFQPRADGGMDVFGQEREESPSAPWRVAQLTRAFSQVQGAIWVTDRQLNLLFAFGEPFRTRQGPGRTPLRDYLQLPDGDSPTLRHHRAALGGDPQAFRLCRGDRYYDVQVQPVREESGEVSGCVGAAVDVTARAQVEEELARTAAQLREAQRVAHLGSFEWNLHGDRVEWSEEMHRIYGLRPGQFHGSLGAFLALVAPEDREHTRQVLREALRRGGPFEYEHQIVRQDGQRRTLFTRADMQRDEEGRLLRLVGSCWDVTELRRATEERERARSALEATLEATADGVLVVDRQGHLSHYNRRFLEMWRIPPGQLDGERDERLLEYVLDQLANPQAFLEKVKALYGTPGAESHDTLYFRDGRVFERTSRPQQLPGGELLGRVWSFHDVTERERLLAASSLLAEAGRLLASLDIEQALQAVARLAVPVVGEACAIDLLEVERYRQVASHSACPGLFFAPTPVPPADLTPALERRPEAVFLTVPLVVKDRLVGALRMAWSCARGYRPEDQALAEELARRLALAVDNAQLYTAAVSAVRTREEFLAIAAHEIRGPLASLRLAVQTLGKGKVPPEGVGRVLELIDRDTRRLAAFVEELLELGRIRRDQLLYRYEEVDLEAVVREVAARLEGDRARAGSRLELHCQGPTTGLWDRFRLEQVLTNLLGNALKFGRGQPIAVFVSGDEERVVLSVADQGMGLAPGMAERIFNPFERGVSARHYGGLGLGLYIVRTVVEGMGGTITVTSEPGRGATFRVELPRKRSDSHG